jgi:hypothetical protein
MQSKQGIKLIVAIFDRGGCLVSKEIDSWRFNAAQYMVVGYFPEKSSIIPLCCEWA